MKNNSLEHFPIVQEILIVKEKIFLTPHYIRIVLGGNIEPFRIVKVGENNKIVLPNSDNKVIIPTLGKDITNTIIRTYTTRFIDFENQTLTIDFAAHGKEGPASAWAINANIGDPLGVLMKQKHKPLFQPADNYLLVGDHTALPVIAAILEQLPKAAKGKATIEVYAEEDILQLEKPNGIEIEWLYNSKPGKIDLLSPWIEQYQIPKGSNFIYVAAEYSSANKIQNYLRKCENIERSEWQTYSYWKYGQSEDNSSSERQASTHKA